MSIESAKSLLQSGFGIWLASFAGVAVAVVVCMTWLDRPIALLAYEWLGRHRAVQHFAETPGFFGPLVVLAFAVLLLRWILARRCGTMDIVATLCIITLAIGEPLKGWLKFIFGRTWPAYGHPSFIFEGAYGFLPFHGGPDLFSWSQRDNRGFSRTRTSSATAPRLPDANQDSLLPLVRRGISRFPRNELLHMPVLRPRRAVRALALTRPSV